MATITLNTAHQKAHVREQLDAVLAAFREMLDVFVSNRMREAAAEAEQVRALRVPKTLSQSMNAR